MRVRLLLLVAAIVVTRVAPAQTDVPPILKGVKPLVTVGFLLDDDLPGLGLDSTRLRTVIELPLRQAGFTVNTPGQARPGGVYLRFSAMVLAGPDDRSQAIVAEMETVEYVAIPRDPPRRDLAVTWYARDLLRVVSVTPVRIAVEEMAKNQVEEFLNDYLAANPKPPPYQP